MENRQELIKEIKRPLPKLLVIGVIIFFLAASFIIGRYAFPSSPNAALVNRYYDGYYDGYVDGKFSATDNVPFVDFNIYPAFLDIVLTDVRSTIVDKLTVSNKSLQTHTFQVETTEPSSLYRYAQKFQRGNPEWLYVSPAPIIIKGMEKLDVPITLVTRDISAGDYVFAIRVYSPDTPSNTIRVDYEMRIFLSITGS